MGTDPTKEVSVALARDLKLGYGGEQKSKWKIGAVFRQ
jgi:hypothetical protein